MANSTRPVDLDAVSQLVEQLERDLARARTGGGSIDTLRAEVEQLRQALAADSPSAEQVTQGLTTVRTRLHDLGDELETDAIIGADYLRRIGRLLGLT
jgi:cob(I)alamin adenosyltransferase